MLAALALGGCGTFGGSLRGEAPAQAAPTPPATVAAEMPTAAPGDLVSVPPAAGTERAPAVVADEPTADSTQAVAQADTSLTVEPITEAEMAPGLLALAESMSFAQAQTDRPLVRR